jgi:DNA-binding LytR/AlgR family response regulator
MTSPDASPTVLIAEDEPLIRAEIVRLIGLCWPGAQIVAVAAEGAEALALWRAHRPQVLFLDIQMPEMTGLEVAQQLVTELDGVPVPHLVFITAYNEHAVAAFDAGAIDYLLKPVKEERLRQCIARLEGRLGLGAGSGLGLGLGNSTPDLRQGMSQLLRQLQTALQQNAPREKEPLRWLSATVGQQIKLIAVDDVLFFQSDNKYTRVVTASYEAFIRKTMKELLAELDGKLFAQVHRSTIVNLRSVDSVVREPDGKGSIRLKGSTEALAVSAAHMGLFRE